MIAADIIALGRSLYGEVWIKQMADRIGYSESHLWRVAYGGHPVTKRMRREVERLERENRHN